MSKRLLLILLMLSQSAVSAVAIKGTLSNASAVPQMMGTNQNVYVWLTNMTQGKVVSRAPLKGDTFFLNIPQAANLPVRPLDLCDGVNVSPRRVPVYQAETILLYQRALDRVVGPLIQADDARNPTRIVRWMYSDVAATIKGNCAGLNTHYNLTLRRGWNGVMTQSVSGRFDVRNADRNLPYWLLGDFRFDRASKVLPGSFFTQR